MYPAGSASPLRNPAVPGSFRRELAAGFRRLRAVPLLTQITVVSAWAFSIIGLNETIVFAVIGQGLHRPPSFFGLVSSVQGAGSVADGLAMTALLRRLATPPRRNQDRGSFLSARGR